MKKTSNDRVASLLTTLSLSPIELARKMKKDPSTVYKTINGDTTPTKTTLGHIADATGASLQWLLTGDEPMMDPNPKSPAPASEGNRIDDAISELKEMFQNQLKIKDEQIAGLMAILQKVNFLNPLQKSDSGQEPEFVREAA